MIEKKLNTIIRRAFQVAKIKTGDVDLTENELNDARYSLNTMLKSWDNRGFHLWKRKTANLVLNKDQSKYSLPGDLCFENIYPTKIIGIQQTGQYFLPVNTENLAVNMDVYIPDELNENEAKIKEILNNKIRLNKELFRTFAQGVLVFCGENLKRTKTIEDYSLDTNVISLSIPLNLRDTLFIKNDTGMWLERIVVAVQNGSYVLNENISEVSEGNEVVTGDLLYQKEILENLNIEYKTIILKDTKGFEEGKLVSYFNGFAQRFYNTISVVDGEKVVLSEKISPSITDNYIRKSIYHLHRPFSKDQYNAVSATLENNRICYFDNDNFFQGENVYNSKDKGTSWTPVLDDNGDQVQAYFINKVEDRYYFFHGEDSWYLNKGDTVATKLDLLGHTVLTSSYLLKNLIYKFENKYYILELEDDFHKILTSEDGINFVEEDYNGYNFKNAYLWNGVIYLVNTENQLMINLRENATLPLNHIVSQDLDQVNIFNLDNTVIINNLYIDGTTLEQKDVVIGISFEFYNVFPNGNTYIYANTYNNTVISKDFINYLIIDNDPAVVFLSEEVNTFYLIFADKIMKYSQPTMDRFIDNYSIVAFDTPVKKPDEISNIRLYSFLDKREEYPCIISRNDFDKLPRSDSNGEPTQVYYDKRNEDGIINVWNTPNEDCLYMEIDYVESLEPLESSREIPDFTDQFVEAVIYNLAYKLAIEYGVPVEDLTALKAEATEMLEMADMHDNEDCSIYLRPGR